MPRAIVLIGFMGSGKNTVGQELARRLSWDLLDLDARIESRESQSIPEIFNQKGEPYFRAAETAALRDLLASLTRDTVIALGGGAFAQEPNRTLLRPWPSVFLDAPIEELWQRCLDHESADGADVPCAATAITSPVSTPTVFPFTARPHSPSTPPANRPPPSARKSSADCNSIANY